MKGINEMKIERQRKILQAIKDNGSYCTKDYVYKMLWDNNIYKMHKSYINTFTQKDNWILVF